MKETDVEKEAEGLDDTYPDDMEEGINDRKYEKNEKMMRENRQNAHMTLPLLIWRKV